MDSPKPPHRPKQVWSLLFPWLFCGRHLVPRSKNKEKTPAGLSDSTEDLRHGSNGLAHAKGHCPDGSDIPSLCSDGHFGIHMHDLDLCSQDDVGMHNHGHHNHASVLFRPWQFCHDGACKKKGDCNCPCDVPQGFLAVYAGRERKRFVIPALYLNHPAFRLLLEKVKEEFGFSQKGGLNMPFEVLLFERFLWLVGHGEPVPGGLDVEELEKFYSEKYHLTMETIPLDD